VAKRVASLSAERVVRGRTSAKDSYATKKIPTNYPTTTSSETRPRGDSGEIDDKSPNAPTPNANAPPPADPSRTQMHHVAGTSYIRTVDFDGGMTALCIAHYDS
jgi:hypothetical protein